MNALLQAAQLQAFDLLSRYLNFKADALDAATVQTLQQEVGCDSAHAVALLTAAACGLDTATEQGKTAFHRFFEPAIRELKSADFASDPYYRRVHFDAAVQGRWQLQTETYKPYELFVCDDIEVQSDGCQVPQIGFFTDVFRYVAVLEGGREWMTVTPNEIRTMHAAVETATGSVLTFGLGLGYYAYMVARKEQVQQVTVVERDADVIRLFREHLLPQFEPKVAAKIHLVQCDAFDYAACNMAAEHFDCVFTDLWHDPSDGVELYLRMRTMEYLSPASRFDYWIERTLKCYLH